ncbi:MAG: nucleotide exchange factor GrpE [Thermoanaerobacteraceae bacterium]|nr:nucleotide exchange factor GrpE [Thermoanaerobacteraceae bacterium]
MGDENLEEKISENPNDDQTQGEEVRRLIEEIDSLKEENSGLKQQLNEYENLAKRAMADYDNYKKRMEKEKNELVRYSNEKLILDLLPIIDNMERAIESFKDNDSFKDYYEGIKMVLNQLYKMLEKYEVKEIIALGEEFNPYLHHAIAQVEDNEHKSNTVVEVLLKGYTLGDKVIRPSLVKVAK